MPTSSQATSTRSTSPAPLSRSCPSPTPTSRCASSRLSCFDAPLTHTFPHAQGYVRHTHEQAIISAIEEGRRATTADFYRNLDTKMRREWERQKEKMFDELGRHHAQAGPSTETSRRLGGQNGFERSVRFPSLGHAALQSTADALLLLPTGTGCAASLRARLAPNALQDDALRPCHPPPQRVPQRGVRVRPRVCSRRGFRRLFLWRLGALLSAPFSHPLAPANSTICSARRRRPRRGASCRTSSRSATFSTASSSAQRSRSASTPRRTSPRTRSSRVRSSCGG